LSDVAPNPETSSPESNLPPHEKVKTFPSTPGVYLMKDSAGTVIYVGKAKSLRSRAGSYFLAAAAEDSRTSELVKHIADIDFISTATEVEALLKEARLVKDIRPKFNKELKDDKTFPYLQIRTREEYPRVEITRKPRRKGVKLYGPFTSAKSLRMALQVLQKVFKFRTCSLDISEKEEKWRWYRPCLLASIRQCTAPCNFRVSKDEYRKQIRGLRLILEGKRDRLLTEMHDEMMQASAALLFEKAARIRNEIQALQKLDLRGNADTDVQPEAFHTDPKKGLAGLQKVLGLRERPRTIEGIDIAHLSGDDTVASLVSFLDGLPFKQGYRKYKIKSVEGIDDFASMREVVSRRFRRSAKDEHPFPDIILIDGGKGQLNAAVLAFEQLGIEPPTLISLAKQEEEIFRPGESESIKLSRSSAALRLLQFVRDEAHRFAQYYHHQLRDRRLKDQFDKK